MEAPPRACRPRTLRVALALVVAGCGAGGQQTTGASTPATGTITIPSAAPSASAPAASATAVSLAEPPPRTNHGSGPDGCFTREELAARQAQVKSDRRATYVEALRRDGLRPVHLTARRLRSGSTAIEFRGPVPPAHVEEREIAPHRRVKLIVTPPTGGCGDLSTAFEFARGGDRVWLVQRHVHSRKIEVALCGCPGCKCESPDEPGCGGVAMALTTILGYELPDGTHFAGTREVEYVEDFVDVTKVMQPQPACVAPQPRP